MERALHETRGDVYVATMLYKLIRAFAMQHAGLDCRRCGESIRPSDHFGLSEGVCRACRH